MPASRSDAVPAGPRGKDCLPRTDYRRAEIRLFRRMPHTPQGQSVNPLIPGLIVTMFYPSEHTSWIELC